MKRIVFFLSLLMIVAVTCFGSSPPELQTDFQTGIEQTDINYVVVDNILQSSQTFEIHYMVAVSVNTVSAPIICLSNNFIGYDFTGNYNFVNTLPAIYNDTCTGANIESDKNELNQLNNRRYLAVTTTYNEVEYPLLGKPYACSYMFGLTT